MTKQQIIDRVMKVKALADRGVAGERIAAQQLLETLMKKYKIDEADLNIEKTDFYIIDAGDFFFKELFNQLYHVKFGLNRPVWNIEKMPKKTKREWAGLGFGDETANVAIECTKSEFIEVKTLFEIYRRDLREQWRTFIYAYFYKNNLLAPSDPDKEYSDDYKERALKAVLMSRFIDKKEVHKMIEQ